MLTIWVLFFFAGGVRGIDLFAFKVKYEIYNTTEETVCYKEVGCFPVGSPFSYVPSRPVPPPEDPAELKAHLKFVSTENSLMNPDFIKIPLSGPLDTSMIAYEAKKEFTIFMLGCVDTPGDSAIPKWTTKIIDALIRTRASVNIFVFEQEIRRISFMQNASNLRGLGYLIARFIKHLQVTYDMDPTEKVWIIGYGCGCHMAGYAGHRAKIARITGLDPSGFLFENEGQLVRLSRSDAFYVDVHHTNAAHIVTRAGIGMVKPMGHVDFYYNGGLQQPGCPHKSLLGNLLNKALVRRSLYSDQNFNCHHLRSAEYFAWAITLRDTGFALWGYNITTKRYLQSLSSDGKSGIRLAISMLREKCTMETCVPVGWDSPKSNVRGIKVLTTAPTPPYYTSTDQMLRNQSTYGYMYGNEVLSRWIFSFFSKVRHQDPAVPLFPKVPHQCYYSNVKNPLSGDLRFNLGCFNQTSPWMVMRSRPISSPDPPKVQKLEAWWYNRTHWTKGHNMSLYPRVPDDTSHVPFDNRVMTFVVIHGFYNTGKEPWIGTFKDTLLNRTDCTVIVANWGGGALTLDYLQAAGNLRLASRVYSNMLQHFIDHRGLNVSRLHLIGHSLGAHVAGLIAKSIPGIFQITALDPAQPWFEAADHDVRLTKDDANFVVGVHSDASPFLPDLGFGMAEEVGHADFYINGGFKQWKCIVPTTMMETPNFTSIIDLVKPVSQIFVKLTLCPHQTAVDVYTEAIARTDCIFWGQAITMENMVMSAHLDGFMSIRAVDYKSAVHTDRVPCDESSCSPLGLDTYFWPARGSFVIITRSTQPLCIYQSFLKPPSMMTDLVIMDAIIHHFEVAPYQSLWYKRLTWVPLPIFMYFLNNIETRILRLGLYPTFAQFFITWIPFLILMILNTPIQQYLLLSSWFFGKLSNHRFMWEGAAGKVNLAIEEIRKHHLDINALKPILALLNELIV